MRSGTLVTILAAAMAASWILPWIDTPLGSLSPRQGFADFDWQNVMQAAPLTQAFLASFAAAALLLLLSLLGWGFRLLMLLAGVLPFGIAGYVWLDARDRLTGIGVPLPANGNPLKLFDQFRDVLGLGLYIYFGAALLLLVIALFSRAE